MSVRNPEWLKSTTRPYPWTKVIEGPHEVKDKDSGIYSYNYNNYNNYNNYYNYYSYYSYYYNYNNNYNIAGIIEQYGTVAIHREGYRSEYAKIKTLFTIRESDAKGPEEFLNWIKNFNKLIQSLAEKYEANTITWQDFESEKSKNETTSSRE